MFIDKMAKKPLALIGTSGLDNTEIEFPGANGPHRAAFVFNGIAYYVVGTGFYAVSGGIATLKGSLQGAQINFVNIDANTYQILIVDGFKGYIWDTIYNNFTVITDQSFPASPVDVCYLDGYFVVANGGTNSFQLSQNGQGLVWGAAENNFTTAYLTNSQLTIGASTIGGTANTQNYATGVQVVLSTTGTLPAPLTTTDIYYTIQVDNTHLELATSLANAEAGIFITLTNDGSGTQTITSVGQLQQGAITTHPGNIVACRTLHRRLFLFSANYTELWENSGIGYNLPFRRINSALIEYGVGDSPGSIAVSFDMLVFLSQTKDGLGPIMQVTGTQAQPISTQALDNQLSIYALNNQLADCEGFLIKEKGIIFYRMNFTAANHTFIYNVTMSQPETQEGRLWHEEEVLNGDRHPAQTLAYLGGTNYVGSYENSTLYVLNPLTYTNDGEAIRRARIGRPIVAPGYQRRRIDRFQLDLLQGQLAIVQEATESFLELENTGLLLLQDGFNLLLEDSSDSNYNNQPPQIFLSWSKDGGQSYGYVQSLPMGNVGQRTFRTLARKLGVVPRGQAFVPKVEMYDPVPFALLGASWVFEILPQ